jgi:hypothetical protein
MTYSSATPPKYTDVVNEVNAFNNLIANCLASLVSIKHNSETKQGQTTTITYTVLLRTLDILYNQLVYQRKEYIHFTRNQTNSFSLRDEKLLDYLAEAEDKYRYTDKYTVELNAFS